MKSDRCFVLLAAMMLTTAATTVLTACTDDDNVIIPVAQSFNYKTTMFGSSDSQRILLSDKNESNSSVTGNCYGNSHRHFALLRKALFL